MPRVNPYELLLPQWSSATLSGLVAQKKSRRVNTKKEIELVSSILINFPTMDRVAMTAAIWSAKSRKPLKAGVAIPKAADGPRSEQFILSATEIGRLLYDLNLNGISRAISDSVAATARKEYKIDNYSFDMPDNWSVVDGMKALATFLINNKSMGDHAVYKMLQVVQSDTALAVIAEWPEYKKAPAGADLDLKAGARRNA